MGIARFNLDYIDTTAGEITTGSISVADSGSSQAGDIIQPYFCFKIPKGSNIFKKYWNKITIKGYKQFSAQLCRVRSGIKTYTNEDSAITGSYTADTIFGSFSDIIQNSIDKNGLVLSEKYNDSNVDSKRSTIEANDYELVVRVTTRYTTETESGTTIYYRHRFTIGDIQNIYLEIDYDDFGFDVVPVFPVNISIKPSLDNNFAFQINNTGHSRNSFSVTDITLTINQNGNNYTYSLTESQTYQTITANTLVVGQATYEIVSNNTYNEPNTSGIIHFTCVGPSEAPTVTGVTQDSFPVISWISSNQRAWQLIVRGDDGIVFDSGMRAGNEQSYKLTNMLVNGAYYAEVRILNVYGYYTDWGTYGFVMNTTAPGEPTNIIVSVTNNYGVAVNCEAPADAGTLYVVRRPSGTDKSIIIGEYFNGFVDYTIPINATYEYTVRNYNVGYADGEWIDATVNASGIIIRDGRNIEEYINLWKVENGEFNLISNNIREKSLLQCVGRTYPVKESSEWIESTRVVEVFVPYEVYEKLRDMATNSKVVYLQNRGEFLTCDMEISDQGEYIAKGRITQILLTRIDEV